MRQKDNKEHIFVRWRKSIILRIKEELEFIDVKVMAHVLSVVLMVSIIAATVAWYTFSTTAKVTGLYLSSGSVTDFEVSLDENDWKDILEPFEKGENVHEYVSGGAVDITMPAFQNIYDKQGNRIIDANSGIMAPGTYGSFTFYVKSVNDNYTSCALSIAKILDTDVTTEALTDEINQLFEGHILCFAKVEGSEAYEFVSKDTPINITFEDFTNESEPKEVTVYWVWPYEYTDIAGDTIAINLTDSYGTQDSPAKMFSLPANEETMPGNLSASTGNVPETGYQMSMNQIFEWERYNETLADYKTADEMTKAEWLIDWYDYADTLIGSYVSNMAFHIEVEGVGANGEE